MSFETSTSPIIVRITVVGQDATTRETKAFNGEYDGNGSPINSLRQVLAPAKLPLTLTAAATPVPPFPIEEFAAAQAEGDVAKQQALLQAHQTILAEHKAGAGGASIEHQIGTWAIDLLTQFEGFLKTDGKGFVIKLDNLNVTTTHVKDAAGADLSIYTVGGTAVFG